MSGATVLVTMRLASRVGVRHLALISALLWFQPTHRTNRGVAGSRGR
jgi:hypothetical protein